MMKKITIKHKKDEEDHYHYRTGAYRNNQRHGAEICFR
jgi:hypothetical protein